MSGNSFSNLRALIRRHGGRRAALLAVTVRNHAVQLAPVDTGRLRQSIGLERVGPDVWRVGTNVNYARHVEFGTRNQAAQAFLRPALASARMEIR